MRHPEWRVIDWGIDNMYGVQMGKDGGFTLHPDIPDAKGKAKFIILACNHHDELVDVLTDIVRDIEKARALLSKIEGDK